MLWERSSSEKVAAIESNVFWKSDRSKKVALQEKKVFRKCSSPEKPDAVQMYLLRPKELFCRYFYSKQLLHQKVAVPKSNYPKELPSLTKWLLGRSFVPKN